MQGFGTIALFRSSRLLIERTECGEILVTQGNLTLRLDHSGLERLYDAFGDALAVMAMADLGFPPLPMLSEAEAAK